jgi:N-acetylmuramoyl-L-alanine amidase
VLPVVVGARISSTPKRARLVIDLSKKTEFAFSSINVSSGLNQIAIDVRASKIAFSDEISISGEGIVNSIKIELVEEGRVRSWLTLNKFAQVQQAYILKAFEGQPSRLVVDLSISSEDVFMKNAANDIASLNTSEQEASNEQEQSPAILGENSNAPGSLNVKIKSKPLIVIDPGHGGIDGGASASNGAREKDIVLRFAKDLQSRLVESGVFEVALTRSDDEFLRLGERVALARSNQADLFISLHADSFAQANVRGTSIYTRDEEATNKLDKILADNENLSDIIAGFTMNDANEKAVPILVDLMQREMRKQAYLAANSIVDQLKPSVQMRRFPLRKADFLVLQSPDVPSILIELGFLSNVTDANNLANEEWRSRVADAIARGIAIYFDDMSE